LEAERTIDEALRNAVKLTTFQIEKLKLQLSRQCGVKFGQLSERGAETAEQPEGTREEHEAEHACPHASSINRHRRKNEPHRPRSKQAPPQNMISRAYLR